MRPLLLLLALLLVPLAAGATTRYVAPGGIDSGDCSSAAAPCATIAYAVAQSAGGDLVSVAAGLYVAGAVLDRDVAVEGAGQAVTTVAGPFTINAGVTAVLRDLTVDGARVTSDGDATLERVTVKRNTDTGVINAGTMVITDALIADNDGGADRGGGIRNVATGRLTVTRTHVFDNDISHIALAHGGGVYNEGVMTLEESVVEWNGAFDDDDDIRNGRGGGIHNEGTLAVRNTTVRSNGADAGGGIANSGELAVIGSTISENWAAVDHGGVSNGGAMTLVNSTVSGNEGGVFNYGEMTVEATTITANALSDWNRYGAVVNLGTFRMRNTVLAGNYEDCSFYFDYGPQNEPLTSFDYNVIGDLDGCELVGDTTHTLLGVEDPLLESLADNGGPTQTHALLPGSPALDAGACTDIAGNPITEDQRGQPRPRGLACDVGALEHGGVFLTLTPEVTPVVVPPEGGQFAFTVAAMNATAEPQTLEAWVEATQPDGEVLTAPYGPLLGPVTVTLGPGEAVERSLVQRVPPSAMAGAWTYTGYVGTYPDGWTATKAFAVEKQPSAFAVEATLVSPPGGVLPAAGGPFSYEVAVTNVTDMPRTGDFWGALQRPDSVLVAPYVGPTALTLAPGEAFTYVATDTLETSDPAGPYTLAFFGGAYPDGATAADSFAVTKAGPRYVATTGNDDGNCLSAGSPCATIRYALAVAVDGDVIEVAAGTYTEPGLEVGKDVTIRGASAAATVVQAAAEPGTAPAHVFYVTGDAVAAFEDLIIRHGNTGGNGGGLFSDGEVTLTRCVVTANRAGWLGGGIAAGWNGAKVMLRSSTVSGNVAANDGGGIFIGYRGEIEIEHSTIAGNTGTAGGGLALSWSDYAAIRGSVVADNVALSGGSPDCYTGYPAWLISRDYNLIGSTVGCTIGGDTDHDLYGVDPLLGPLADNGGPTLTHALLEGSPAIDAGTCTDLDGAPVTTDQRGAPRPYGPACDIGAFEFGAEPPALVAALAGAPEAASSTEVPAEYALLPAFPNPFSRSATLRYGLPAPSHVRLAVYDLLGREVAVLADTERGAGWHAARLDAAQLAAGPYLVTLTAGDFRATGRVTVVR
jgi:hypothetical protein